MENSQKFKTINHTALTLEMKKYAEECDVPIITDECLEVMLQFLRLKRPKRILEIGTAIGYSSIMMVSYILGSKVVTIERNDTMHEKATEYIGRSNFAEEIDIIHADALEFDTSKLEGQPFDVIFIDGAKAGYQKFFQKYEHLLAQGGMIVSDNLRFHGYVDGKINMTGSKRGGVMEDTGEKISKNLRDLIRKINNYKQWLAENKDYNTLYLPVGDGIAISIRK